MIWGYPYFRNPPYIYNYIYIIIYIHTYIHIYILLLILIYIWDIFICTYKGYHWIILRLEEILRQLIGVKHPLFIGFTTCFNHLRRCRISSIHSIMEISWDNIWISTININIGIPLVDRLYINDCKWRFIAGKS